MYYRALRKNLDYFLQDKSPVCLRDWIISRMLFRPTLSLGCQGDLLRGGGKEGRCVSSPWCSSVFRRIEKNCQEHPSIQAEGKVNDPGYFFVSGPLPRSLAEHFRSKSPGLDSLGPFMSHCPCRPAFVRWCHFCQELEEESMPCHSTTWSGNLAAVDGIVLGIKLDYFFVQGCSLFGWIIFTH